MPRRFTGAKSFERDSRRRRRKKKKKKSVRQTEREIEKYKVKSSKLKCV